MTEAFGIFKNLMRFVVVHQLIVVQKIARHVNFISRSQQTQILHVHDLQRSSVECFHIN